MWEKHRYKSKKKKLDEKQKEYIALGIAVLAVFIISIWYLKENYSLKVWGDEFGYWQSAAFLTGKDWSSVASTNSYYGFGFGILLAPIMLLFGHDAMLMMHAALVMEALMLSSCVFAAYLCVNYFNAEIKGIMRALIAFVPVVYPSNILYVNMTMAEILIVTLIWWYTYVVLRFIRDKKFSEAVTLIVMSVYMYSVHQRTIAIMAISLALIVWMYREKLFTKKLLIVLALLACGLLAVFVFKDKYTQVMYSQTSEAAYEANNLAGQSSKVVNILTTWDGFCKFLQSIIGKFYYVSAASFTLAVLGMIYCGQRLWECVVKKAKADDGIAYLVIVLNYLAAHMIGAIYMSDGYGYRTDILIYGRYIEHTIGPLILLGILYLYEKADVKTILVTMSITALAAILSANTIEYRASNSNIWSNCSAIADLFTTNRYVNSKAIYMALYRAFFFIAVLYTSLVWRKKVKEGLFALGLLWICFTWVSIGYETRNEKVIPWADELYYQQAEVLEHIDEEEFGLYDAYIGGFFQFLRVDAKVKCFESMEAVADYEKPLYIISYAESEDIGEIYEEQDVIFSNQMYVLWKSSVD